MERVKLAVAGMGYRGLGLTKGHQKLKTCKVVAICDSIKPLVEKAYKELANPDIKCYTNFSEMLEKEDIDAVAIYTFPTTQIDLVCEALQAGKHVCCEVPLAYSIEDCWKVILAVEKTGLKFQLNEQVRYHPAIQSWKKMVDEGRLGKIVFAQGQYIGTHGTFYLWQNPASGEFYNLEYVRSHPNDPNVQKTWRHLSDSIVYCVHDISPLLYILNDRVVKVSCMKTRKVSYIAPEIERADIEVALMHTEKDTVIRLAKSGNIPVGCPHHWFNLVGTKGQVETDRGFDMNKGLVYFADSYMQKPAHVEWGWKNSEVSPEALESGHGGLDYYPMANFIQSILDDSSPPMDVYKSVETAAPGIMAASSAKQGGKCLQVPDFRPNASRSIGQLPKNITT